jgi:hypothetical protein
MWRVFGKCGEITPHICQTRNFSKVGAERHWAAVIMDPKSRRALSRSCRCRIGERQASETAYPPPAPYAQPRAYEALGGFRPTPLLISF